MDSKKVLLVEDDPMSSQYYKKMLGGRGYLVYPPAKSGEEAIAVAQEVKPDLIIMDVNIQGEFDGVETATRILSELDVPIIYASGTSESHIVERAKSNAAAYLLKPFTKRDLFITIDVAFAKAEMDRKLRKSEARLSTILGSIANGVIATKSDGTVEYINDSAEFIIGKTRESATGLPLKDIIELRDPEDGSRISPFQGSLEQAIQPVAFQDVVLRSPGGDERRVSLHLSPIKTGDTRVSGLVCVIIDITDQVEADNQLDTLGQALESITDCVLIFDIDSQNVTGEPQIVYGNESFCHNFQIDIQDLTYRTLDTFFGEETSRYFKKGFERAVAEKLIFSEETILYDSKSAPINVAFEMSPVRSSNNRVSKLVAVIRDVTHIRQLEDNMRQSQKIEAIGRLASGIAHDFNNLLSVINSYADLLMTRFDESDPVHEQLNQIFSAGRKGSDLVSKLMAFSRKEDTKIQGMDLHDVLGDIETILARVVRENIELHIKRTIPSAPIRADRSSIEQALINLVVNARDAITDVGTITVNLDDVVITNSNLGVLKKPGHYFRISISDTGSGIAEEDLSHIFDPFFTTKDIGKGTGLGLSLVYGLMQRCDGGIEVNSKLGTGTTFNLYFPEVALDPEEIATDDLEGPITDDELPQAEGQKILIVEDDAVFADCISSLLRIHGFEVLTASNGQEVIDDYADELSDVRLLFSDIVMPKMSGADLAWEVRKANPNVRILFMTGYDEEIEEKYTLPEGSSVLQKPVPLKTVLDRVHEALDGPAV